MATMTESELVQQMHKEQQRLRARVANLEFVLHGMWAMLKDLQPPAAQYGIDSMMSEHFDSMRDMGVEGAVTFERA